MSGAAGAARRPGEEGLPLGGEITAALDEARQLEQRARRLVLLARVHGGEAVTQAWVDDLARESARSRSAVLARLEHGDPLGALRVALTLVDLVRDHGFDAYARALEAMALARGQAGQA